MSKDELFFADDIEAKRLPLIPLRGMNVFPGALVTFDVERKISINALNAAMKTDQLVFLTAQTNVMDDQPAAENIYKVGTVCRIKQQVRQVRRNVCRVLVEGLYRAKAELIDVSGKYDVARVVPFPDSADRVKGERQEALIRSAMGLFEKYIEFNPDMFNEQIFTLFANPQPDFISYYIAQNLIIPFDEKQKVLELPTPSRRFELLIKLMNKELAILEIEKNISDAAQESMNQSQHEYYLREEMKAIAQELGEDGDDMAQYREKLEALPVSDEVKDKLLKDLGRLQKQPYGSSEAAVLRGYLDTCLEIPWGVKTQETIDIAKARKQLDDDHFGLEKVKERIIEYLSVKQLAPDVKGGLICLVGPPGTGKTSIAMSIAKATNRKLCRISLGGVHDEAEIRGHRKTYIGAMPGRIINGIIQAGSCNPLMVLDEVDKLGSDYKGDPSSALLEVLDGEQNSTFRDNFLEIPFDLSDVFFITTANTTDTIPRPLLDRMEVIELSSYTDEEKLQIAKQHLIPKQRKKHGLKANQLKMDDGAIKELITLYTRESGVRLLEREVAAVCRKAAAGIAEGKFKSLSLKAGKLESVLGPAKYKPEHYRYNDEVGLVHGLAYTSVGGETLDVEASVVEGTGKLELTGNLGDVMKESAKAAITFIRSRALKLGIDPEFYKNCDIHLHFPEGAVPKDGPSAGVTTCVALVSALTGTPVRHDVAMTGEITLRGRILPIGGLREKTMAALRSGIKTVIIPADNEADLAEIDQTVRGALNFIPVSSADEALEVALIPKDEIGEVNDAAVYHGTMVKNSDVVRQ